MRDFGLRRRHPGDMAWDCINNDRGEEGGWGVGEGGKAKVGPIRIAAAG